MKINFIELIGFKRMKLMNIKRFHYQPKEIIQLILGTNGSGKSSLLAELSPLPASSVHYTKEGSKTISISHRGHDYLLKSWFSSGQKHSFIKDGEEINKGQTLTVQKELVKQEFNYDQDSHDLIIGIEKFTQMSPIRRREWFTRMCDANYDYAISIYNKAKEKSRDISGALKLAKKRLVGEVAKIVDAQAIDQLNQKVDSIVKELDYLYHVRSPQELSTQELTAQRYQLEQDLMEHCQSLFRLKGLFQNKTMWMPEEYDIGIEQTKEEIASTKTRIQLLTKEHDELVSKLKVFEKTGGSSLEELNNRLKALQDNKTLQLQSQSLKLQWSDPRACLSALNGMYEMLSECLMTLPENRERQYSQHMLLELKEKELDIRGKLLKAHSKLDELRHTKTHLEQLRSGDQTQCPQCHHRWTLGYEETVYAQTLRSLEQGEKYIAEQTKLQSALLENIEKNQAYGESLRQYLRCVKASPVLQPLWDHLTENDTIYNAPRMALTLVDQALRDLRICEQALSIDEEISKTKDLIQLAIKATNEDVGKISTRIDKIDEEMGYLTKHLTAQQNKLQEDLLAQSRIRDFLKLESVIQKGKQELESNCHSLLIATKNDIISQTVKQLQIELAQQNKLLNEINLQKGIVKNIEDQIEKLTLDDEAHKLIVATLSPTEGLIAEGLLGFIHSFLKKMNAVIRKVWTYPMEVLDCNNDPESADLDYRFPVKIQDDETNIIEDVKLGSTGMLEIFDIAFRMIAARCLGLEDFPLYLDEPGAGFDNEHKLMVPRLIDTLIAQMQTQQVFIISHDFAQYASLSNNDVVVLSPENIVVPRVYNTCVELH